MKKETILDAARLVSHLENNRLVQAHAITCRLEGSFQDQVLQDHGSRRDVGDIPPNKPQDANNDPQDANEKPKEAKNNLLLEADPNWKAYRSTIRVKQFVLAGDNSQALAEAQNLMTIVSR